MQSYLEQFQNTVDIIEQCGGKIGWKPGIMPIVAEEKEMTVKELAVAKRKEVQDHYLAAAFILG